MGKGSTKNEQKVNAHLSEIEKVREKQVREEIKALTSLPYFRRDADYSKTLMKLRGMLSKSITKQKRSPNHTQSGKRGGRS